MNDGCRLSSISPSRVIQLEKIGFCWHHKDHRWLVRYGELLKFIKHHGHAGVPTTYEGNQELAGWVKVQRRQYKLFTQNQKSSMSIERVAMLNKVGFIWSIKDLPLAMDEVVAKAEENLRQVDLDKSTNMMEFVRKKTSLQDIYQKDYEERKNNNTRTRAAMTNNNNKDPTVDEEMDEMDEWMQGRKAADKAKHREERVAAAVATFRRVEASLKQRAAVEKKMDHDVDDHSSKPSLLPAEAATKTPPGAAGAEMTNEIPAAAAAAKEPVTTTTTNQQQEAAAASSKSAEADDKKQQQQPPPQDEKKPPNGEKEKDEKEAILALLSFGG
mmetsp:Transcript_8950/g.21298  ORF Transcript_8950/g.21298 Transcript_8950/m.21298 type:complete len:328 (-) Transcript_8950:178-1161(-)